MDLYIIFRICLPQMNQEQIRFWQVCGNKCYHANTVPWIQLFCHRWSFIKFLGYVNQKIALGMIRFWEVFHTCSCHCNALLLQTCYLGLLPVAGGYFSGKRLYMKATISIFKHKKKSGKDGRTFRNTKPSKPNMYLKTMVERAVISYHCKNSKFKFVFMYL